MNRREALAALVGLPEIARISKASVKPTDVIVVECEGPLSDAAQKYIRNSLRQIWPDQKIVVLDNDVKIKVLEQGQG